MRSRSSLSCESVERVLADRDEHPETWLAVDFRLPHETVLHQGTERIEQIAPSSRRGNRPPRSGKNTTPVDKQLQAARRDALGRV